MSNITQNVFIVMFFSQIYYSNTLEPFIGFCPNWSVFDNTVFAVFLELSKMNTSAFAWTLLKCRMAWIPIWSIVTNSRYLCYGPSNGVFFIMLGHYEKITIKTAIVVTNKYGILGQLLTWTALTIIDLFKFVLVMSLIMQQFVLNLKV